MQGGGAQIQGGRGAAQNPRGPDAQMHLLSFLLEGQARGLRF